jgi:hypothetical protein
MFRKKIFFENKIFYNKVIAEDYDLFVRLREFTKFANIPKVLLKYRTHTTNIGTVQRNEQNKSANLIRENLLKELGVDYSKLEWATHLKICFGEYHNDKHYLNDAMDWINKLIEINKSKKLYPERIFTKIAYNIWLDLYNHTTYYATDIIRKNFGLSLFKKLETKDAIKIFASVNVILIKNLLKTFYVKS